MKLVPREQPYKIRLACTPVIFRKHGWAFKTLRRWPISPALEDSEKDLDVAWNIGRFMPSIRYAAFVFDRECSRLRILEESSTVYGPIGAQSKDSKINMASPTKGWDWSITVSEKIDSQGKKSRDYKVALDLKGPTTFTEEEVQALENPNFQRELLETKYFKKATPEEIKELYEQLPEELRKNTPRDKKGAAPAVKPTAPKVADVAKQAAQAKPAAAPVKPAAAAPAPAAKPAQQAPAVAPAKPTPPPQTKTVVNDDSFLADAEPPDETPKAQEDGEEPARMF
jgi:hypothetical protein